MFRITEDPSSGRLVQCLAKITRMCLLTWTRSLLWQHIVTRCVRAWFTVYVNGHHRTIPVIFSQALYKAP